MSPLSPQPGQGSFSLIPNTQTVPGISQFREFPHPLPSSAHTLPPSCPNPTIQLQPGGRFFKVGCVFIMCVEEVSTQLGCVKL